MVWVGDLKLSHWFGWGEIRWRKQGEKRKIQNLLVMRIAL